MRICEIDIVLEANNGDLACIEVKASASIRSKDSRAIAEMRDHYPDRFKCGVILYSGEQTLPVSDRVWAVPISGLWA